MSNVGPFDPSCQIYAADMESLDYFIFDGPESYKEAQNDMKALREMRRDYIRKEEGTYNPENGHFLCDNCYIKVGMPSSSEGWVCP